MRVVFYTSAECRSDDEGVHAGQEWEWRGVRRRRNGNKRV